MENFIKQEKTIKVVVKYSGVFSEALRKNVGGFRSFFTISNDEKVFQTKMKIYNKSNIPISRQVLKKHDGSVLSNSHFTFEYIIRPQEVFVLLVQEDNVDPSSSDSGSSSSGGDAPDSGCGGFGGGNRGLGNFQEKLEGEKKINGGGYDGGGGGCAKRLPGYHYFLENPMKLPADLPVLACANLAMEKLNHTPLRGQMIRVMWSRRDSDARKSGIANLFVKKGRAKAMVQYETEESATAAINSVNGSTVDYQALYVGPFVKKSEQPSSNSDSSFTNLYIKNLDLDVTEELLTEKFSKYGKITHLVIMKDGNSKSKGFGFVNFDSPDEAKKAMEATDGMQIGSKVLYVGRAQKKAEREKILHDQFEERRKEQLQKFKGSNVYVKNIDDSVNDDELRSIFSKCGTITSAKIMLDEKGMSKGFGFVCFTTIEAAYQAVNSLHGILLIPLLGIDLWILFAQKKEERRTQLQIQFSQGIAGLAVPTSAAVIPARYLPLYYTLPPNMVPPQGLMHQPLGLTPEWGTSRFLPPARSNFHSVPRPVIPDSSRQNKKKWGRMNAHMVAQAGGQSVSFMPHSTIYPSASDYSERSKQSIKYMTNVQKMGEMKNGSQRVSSIAGSKSVGGVAATSQPLEGLQTLSTMLAAASPQHQKQMLGECLYPLVFKLQRDLAAKITGMLLEMDNSELLLLLESPALLVIKVEEAVQILKSSKTTRSSGAGQDSLHPNYMSAAQVQKAYTVAHFIPDS
ncbi:hypothetical protein C5167_026285 [Papaver somniferum]|nr:hypothetical protein C5167_026285 [Papaver somniferum]